MSETIGRNSISGELLRGFIERVEAIDEQIADLRDDKRVVLAEVQAAGLVPAGIRYIVKKRKMKPSERAEAEALEGMYMHAMGMAADNPLFRAAGLMSVDITAKESVVEAMKRFVPANGSIVIEAGGTPIRLTRDEHGNVSVMEVAEKQTKQSGNAAPASKPPKADVPAVDDDGAERLGRAAFRDDAPIIANPFPYGDSRRARWDRGWRDESGGDGMDD